MSVLTTFATPVISGVLAAVIALGFDRWNSSHTRRAEGRAAIDEMQRVLADLSESMLAEESIIDTTPLQAVSREDVALARRAAYPYRDLLQPSDRHLITKSSLNFERYSDIPYDNRQIDVNEWAMSLDHAIQRAFTPRWRQLLRSRQQQR